MSSVNKVILVGNLGRDPEIRAMSNGGKVANLSVATSERWTDKNSGEKKEKTEWHRVIIFDERLVGVIEKYVKKGSKLYLEGQLQTRKWTDQNGVEKHSTEVVLQKYRGQLVLLDSKSAAGSYTDHQAPTQTAPPGGPDLDDPIPFAPLRELP